MVVATPGWQSWLRTEAEPFPDIGRDGIGNIPYLDMLVWGGSQRTGEGREIWFMKYVPVVLDQETIRPPRVGREKYVTRRNERGKRGQSVPTATTGIQNLKAQKTSQPPPIITQ